MTKRVEELEVGTEGSSQGLGVVFVDLNGLKSANDSKGHSEGDEMLKSVACKLRSVYGDKEIYRAGGDEFLIIVPDMDRDDFYAHFDQLVSLSRVDGEPSFALGAHYADKTSDIGEIMQVADKNMYRNKAEYYEANPDLDRRSF